MVRSDFAIFTRRASCVYMRVRTLSSMDLVTWR